MPEEIPPLLYEKGEKYSREYLISWLMARDFTREEAEKIYEKLLKGLEPRFVEAWAKGLIEKFREKTGEVIG
jgi:hypothetical protein